METSLPAVPRIPAIALMLVHSANVWHRTIKVPFRLATLKNVRRRKQSLPVGASPKGKAVSL